MAARTGVAHKRMERLCSMLRQQRVAEAMALAEALHRSANKVKSGTENAKEAARAAPRSCAAGNSHGNVRGSRNVSPDYVSLLVWDAPLEVGHWLTLKEHHNADGMRS